jgi:hypothetical protein
MASTRNRNTPGDYKMEQVQYDKNVKYNTNKEYGQTAVSHHPGDGLMGARTCRNALAYNACDIESTLFGIGSTNLVNHKEPTNPQLKNLKTLDFMERPKVFVVEPRSLNSDQRPMIFN